MLRILTTGSHLRLDLQEISAFAGTPVLLCLRVNETSLNFQKHPFAVAPLLLGPGAGHWLQSIFLIPEIQQGDELPSNIVFH